MRWYRALMPELPCLNRLASSRAREAEPALIMQHHIAFTKLKWMRKRRKWRAGQGGDSSRLTRVAPASKDRDESLEPPQVMVSGAQGRTAVATARDAIAPHCGTRVRMWKVQAEEPLQQLVLGLR